MADAEITVLSASIGPPIRLEVSFNGERWNFEWPDREAVKEWLTKRGHAIDALDLDSVLKHGIRYYRTLDPNFQQFHTIIGRTFQVSLPVVTVPP